ncbi:hypothetical protein AB0873_25190 [Micromonospora sp. NPDC047707]|uniref:hypothetical protein n=1 Tax=Micromonospora sp. NPDC047707 TaxID=3154498 RepID=UPI003455D99D
MTRDELEQAVRETLTRQVAEPRLLGADHADVAIRRARRAQRRRTAVGLALAAVITVTASAGLTQLARDPSVPGPAVVVLGDPEDSGRSAPTPALPLPAPAEPAAVDLIVDDVLVTTAARQVRLTGVGAVERAQRSPDAAGWLLVGTPTPAGRSLWVVRPNGVAQVLLAGAAEIALSRDARLVAWREGGELVKGSIVNNQVMTVARHSLPAGAAPVGFVGDEVLLRLHAQRGGHGVWDPVTGETTTEAGAGARHIYGVRPDGLVVGQVLAGTPGRPCLALLDPARALTVVRTGCGPALAGDGRGTVSPDGRWLLVNGEATALLVDLDRMEGAPVTRPAGPPLTGPAVWTADVAVHVVDGNRLARVDPEPVLAGQAVPTQPLAGVPADVRPLPVAGTGF